MHSRVVSMHFLAVYTGLDESFLSCNSSHLTGARELRKLTCKQSHANSSSFDKGFTVLARLACVTDPQFDGEGLIWSGLDLLRGIFLDCWSTTISTQ